MSLFFCTYNSSDYPSLHYWLLWGALLIAAICLFGAMVCFIARREKKWLRVLLSVFLFPLPFLPGLILFSLIGILYYTLHTPPDWLYYTLSWILALTCAAVILCRRGFWRKNGIGEAAGKSWPAGQLLLGSGVALLLCFFSFGELEKQIGETKAALRQKATALGLSIAPPPLTNDQNAAPIYWDFATRYYPSWEIRKKVEDLWLPILQGKPLLIKGERVIRPLSLEEREEMLQYLSQQTGALTRLRKATELPGCNPNPEYANLNSSTPNPVLIFGQKIGKYLAFCALAELENGHIREAYRHLETLFCYVRQTDSGLRGINVLLTSTLQDLSLEVLEQLLAKETPDQETLTRLSQQLTIDFKYSYRCAVRGERAFAINELINPPQGIPAYFIHLGYIPTWAANILSAPYEVFFWDRDVEETLRLLSVREGFLYLYSYEELKSTLKKLKEKKPCYFFSYTQHLNNINSVDNALIAETRKRLGQVALAATAFRLKNGRYPGTLPELEPEFIETLPLDPFDNQPLRMKASEGGLVIYSIGTNLLDDGGDGTRKENAEKIPECLDLIFRLGARSEKP